jgi:hypothetical protein
LEVEGTNLIGIAESQNFVGGSGDGGKVGVDELDAGGD